MHKDKSRKIKNKKALYLIGILLFLGLAYLAVSLIYRLPPFHGGLEDQYVSLNKTDTEKAAIDTIKKEPSQKTKNNQTDYPDTPKVDSQTGLQQVNVLITSVEVRDGQVSVSGFVTDTAEEGGTCTYIFTNNDKRITKDTTTLPSPTSVSCKTLYLPVGEFTAMGTWNVSIQYTSQYATGTSSQRSFKL